MRTIVGTKKCNRCDTEKPFSEYYPHKKGKYGLYGFCKECTRAKRREYYVENPEKAKEYWVNYVIKNDYNWWRDKGSLDEQHKEARKWYRIKSRYGLDREQWEELRDAQNGVCAICEEPPAKEFHVDHDHACCPGEKSCGKCIRGLLCEGCNLALGRLDKPGRLAKALEYLGGDCHKDDI